METRLHFHLSWRTLFCDNHALLSNMSNWKRNFSIINTDRVSQIFYVWYISYYYWIFIVSAAQAIVVSSNKVRAVINCSAFWLDLFNRLLIVRMHTQTLLRVTYVLSDTSRTNILHLTTWKLYRRKRHTANTHRCINYISHHINGR